MVVIELLVETLNPLIGVGEVHNLMTSNGTLDIAFLFGHPISLEMVNNIRKTRTLKGGSTFVHGAGVGVFVPVHTFPCYQL